MRSIGETARDSGLSVSALRFYDGAGVLVPVRVDPASGYRWYGPEQVEEARLLARLRRAGMPVADIRLVLAGWAARTPTWSAVCSGRTCTGSNGACPMRAASSPRSAHYSTAGRTP